MVIASDEMEGRQTGSEGQKKAGVYMIDYYKNLGVSYPKALGSYYQKVPKEALKAEEESFLIQKIYRIYRRKQKNQKKSS